VSLLYLPLQPRAYSFSDARPRRALRLLFAGKGITAAAFRVRVRPYD
jgi:hypothetical protein